MTLKGKISSVDDVNRINAVAAKMNCKVTVSCGSTIVDAKSFVELFPLIGNEVNIVVGDSVNPRYFKRMFKMMGI